jgi:hypothetical protein
MNSATQANISSWQDIVKYSTNEFIYEYGWI